MYHYSESGLRNVWLVNGYKTEKTPYGESVAIEDVLGLHRAIGCGLIANPRRLTGAEFRFLRIEQELSQKSLGDLLGVEAQAVARWETGKTRVPKWADHFLRGLFHEFVNGDGTLREIIERINALDARVREELRFELEGHDWQPKAA